MRLTCPRCGAQYEIAESAIPALGREVECSACSHVWFQPGAGKSAAEAAAGPYDPQERPALNRALDESVLAILREEAARELQARKAEIRPDGADHIPATAAAGPDMGGGDAGTAPAIDWPATTLTETAMPVAAAAGPIRAETPDADADTDAQAAEAAAPAGAGPEAAAKQAAETRQTDAAGPGLGEFRTAEPLADEPLADESQPGAIRPDVPRPTETAPAADWPEAVAPALPDAAELAATLTRPGPPRPETEEPAAASERPLLRPALPEQEPAPAEAAPVAALVPALVPPPAPRRSGYAAGFGLAAMLALGVVALYALAPQIPAEQGGGVLAEWRQDIDRGRLWLHDRILGQ
ncbi:zinc-ribbon domain-containing protein [Paracoccus sp. TOH]|uniref:zinc-ribbon domain-containing protein n=1 Tax=Paracoccus sp. TOH TaxID=1263728 RepID=UPI0025AF1C91|nr:zinc-ribbon domain-containing protein [Paracoccus sp. TOH]WJS84528.1 zinc-ribbon domain-containing protein [Paracoccus sp. TOH]